MKVVDKIKMRCPCCTDTHMVKIVALNKTADIKGIKVDYEARSIYCDGQDAYRVTPDLADYNDTASKDAYRVIKGFLTSDEIIDLRKRYGISQRDLAVVLQWGLKTITRYESHQLQDAAHDSIMRKLDKDPQWFLELLDACRDELSEGAYNKYCAKVNARYVELQDEYIKNAVLAGYAGKETPEDLDAIIEKVKAVLK